MAGNQSQAAWVLLYPVDIEDPSKPSSTSKRLKGKARKEAKEAQAQIKDFVSLAEFIAGCTNPVIQVPNAFATALDQAIKLRAQHNDRSQESRSEDDKESRIAADATHSYFLGILERPFKASDTANSQDTEAEEGFANRFGTLALEEPSQAFLDAPGLPTKPESEAPLQTSYEAETDQSQQEKYLAAHCLMNDIRNIRSFVRQRWTNCAEQQLSLVSVSVATNTAISLVRDMEEEFATRFPGTSGYEDICGPFYQVQCLIRGESAETKERQDDLINFKVYDLAEDCLVTTYTTLSSLQDVVKPGVVPVYKQGHFGFRDKSKTWEKMTPRGKFKDDQLILFEAFPDLVLLSMITSRSPLAEDELIRGIRAMLPGRPMPLWLVFAGRCFLDIQHTMNDAVGNGYAHLERTAHARKSSIQINADFHKTLRIENWPKSNDLQFTELLGIIDNWVMQDVIAERRAKIKMKVPTQDVIAEPFFLLKQYPMICGLFTFALKARYQELCVVVINAWGSVMYAGHLYNAVRQENYSVKPGGIWNL
ncbi:MAG: hypothetical protein LQ348_002920 [Seirophora lacunosa]|nr:MAG: hypothetical protein LQ348_002920 [Seirophora lacunosa]